MTKKKYPGGLKVFLLLLSIILLGTFSTCYAVDYTDFDIPLEFWDSIQDYGNLIYGKSNKIGATELESLYNTKKNDFKNTLLNFDSSITDRNLMSVIFRDNNELTIYFLVSNNSIGSTDYRTKAYYSGSSGYLEMKGPMLVLKAYYGGGVSSTATIQPSSYTNNIYISSGFYANITLSQQSDVILENTPYFGLNASPLNIIYCNFPKFYNGYKYYMPSASYNINPIPVIPDEPSGDESSSGDNSGDTPGGSSIDYSNHLIDIRNTISGEAHAIRENDNQNTEKIVNAINGANVSYWGSGDDLNGEEQQEFLDAAINELIDNVSGELSRNAVFSEMERGEDIFLDFFRNKQDESFYDLIISWDSISPLITMYGGSSVVSSSELISGDSINLSALCRNNETLSTIQQYIRIIFNFGTLIALLWQIYNLILSTLGIDNPYLYEDAQVTDVVNGDTGEVHSYYRTRRRIYKKR